MKLKLKLKLSLLRRALWRHSLLAKQTEKQIRRIRFKVTGQLIGMLLIYGGTSVVGRGWYFDRDILGNRIGWCNCRLIGVLMVKEKEFSRKRLLKS